LMTMAGRWMAWPTPPPKRGWKAARWCSTDPSHGV
jgi:hypothetical protein